MTLQQYLNSTHISRSAGLWRTNFMFRPRQASIKKEQRVEFGKTLRVHLKQRLRIIRDGLNAHHSKLLRESLDCADGEIERSFLPPHSPDLTPVQYLWDGLKRQALANFRANNLDELNTTARAKLKSARRRPSIIATC